MPRAILRVLLLLLLVGVARETWSVFGPGKERPFWHRYHSIFSDAGKWAETAVGRLQPMVSGKRTWTDRSGRTLEAIATAADDTVVQLRVIDTQTVHNLPLEKLSDGDRAFVEKWRASFSAPDRPEASPPERWPAVHDRGVIVAPTLAESGLTGASQVWRTHRYELRCFGPLDPVVVRNLASICESIDGACRAAPLPMLWGRSDETLLVISIYSDEKSYLAAGGLPGTARCFVFATGEVLISEPDLRESDFLGEARGYSLEKRRRYHVLVHELVHQASIGITMGGFPARVPEGLAEFFSATQNSPGRFQFRNSHLAVKAHAIGSMPFDGVVELERYPVWSLERFLDRNLFEWNRITAKNSKQGQSWIQYFQAAVLVEFFCRADSTEGRRFRSFLEAVLTGAKPHEAAAIHLLAGRSYADLEQAIIAYWSSRGLVLDFSNNPSIENAGIRFGVGLAPGGLR